MSESNFVDLSQLYPWTHPDEFDVVLGGPVGPDSAPIITFDTYATLTELRDNDKPPFSNSPGTLPEPGRTVFLRINESYQGASARLLLYYAHGTGTMLPSGEELTKWMEIPLQNGWADTNGDGTPDSYLDGGKFEPVANGAGEFLELEPVGDIPGDTLALEGIVRENPAADNPEEANVQDRSLDASVAQAAAPAGTAAGAAATGIAAALDPNDISTAFGQAINGATTTLASSAAAIDAAIRSLGSGPADGLADEFTALVNELNAGGLTTVRTNEIMTQLDAIAGQLPASLSTTAASITSAIGPALNPGNLPGLESLVQGASGLVSGLAPVAGEAMSGLANNLNLAAGASLSDLSQISQSFGAGLRETTALLSSGNLRSLVPDVNKLFDFDPTALIRSIDLGGIANSISRLNIQDLLPDLTNISQIVDQMEAAFGPIGRGFTTGASSALSALRGVVDPGFGYDGARPTRDGVGVRRTARVTPEGSTTPTGTPYQRLVSALNTSLTQDWQTRNSQGTPPAGQDPRGRDQIPPPPAGANPLIMEAYRISGQTEFTRDGQTGEYSWQTAFVNYILSTAGFEIVQSMSAQAYYSYGTRINHTNPRNMQARKGDLVIFNSRTGAKYIGFFWDFNAETRKVSILGGNLDGRVKVQEFPFSLRDGDFYVTHIRRGAWQPAETTTTNTVDTTDDARAAASRTPGVHPTSSGPRSRGGIRGWTAEDAARVEDLRSFNETLGGGGASSQLTPGERAYAQSRGYLS